MPRRPAASGYERLAQAEEEEYLDNSDEEQAVLSRVNSDTHYAPIQPGRRGGRMSRRSSGYDTPKRRGLARQRSNSGVDIKAINARLERWADEIASKFRRRKERTVEDEPLEIHYSVFQSPEGFRPKTPSRLLDHPESRMTKAQFDDTVESINIAIEQGMHPKMISKGSSGSYFARNSQGKTVGVFKPKDEEPYASKNPKWTKWLHRNLFPCFFGRACLIPNLSYISEAAAYVLDSRLQTNIVPYTDVVSFSSIAFHYDIWERRAYYRKRKALPPKLGSLQVFLKGYEDATQFLQRYPWPDQANVKSRSSARKRSRWRDACRGSFESDDDESEELPPGRQETQERKQFWTPSLQQSFREELEKLVILDYIMRNTDRGLDNWMIHIDQAEQKASIVAEPPKLPEESAEPERSPYLPTGDMQSNGPQNAEDNQRLMLGAIDNSLSWPWKHPDAWRSFPFGWLFLPVSLIGQPFSQKTRDHFLTLLTSKQWWSETQLALRKCFSQDSDFQEKMYARQIAVMKGQAWNVVETLKTADHGPLELTRRGRVHVWDDVVDVPTAMPMVRSPPRNSLEATRRLNGAVTKPLPTPPREEMDISSALSPAANVNRSLLDLGHPSNGIPTTQKFSLSRQTSEEGERPAGMTNSPISRPDKNVRFTTLGRMSSELPRSPTWKRSRKRNLSFTARAMSDHEEDDDGDLGYAAARDMEGNHKKVIVERLETVKAKNPVFTWC
ncbi:MAG: hypothetical protein Q9159_002941 [Coniocarpon cinnabarinum]